MFSVDGVVIIWRERSGGGICLKLDVQVQGGGRILDVAEQGGWGALKTGQFSWTSYVYRLLQICNSNNAHIIISGHL